ncbi:MAG: hydantoinase/oxoprolinase family protein, partial [Pseudomonadota bacterium]
VPLTVENGAAVPPTRAAIRAAFETTYRAAYGRLLKNAVRVLNLRTAVIGRRPKFDLTTLAPAGDGLTDAPRATRRVRFGGAWYETAIFARLALPVGTVIEGPAILEQPDTTILVEPGYRAAIDRFGNAILERKEVLA